MSRWQSQMVAKSVTRIVFSFLCRLKSWDWTPSAFDKSSPLTEKNANAPLEDSSKPCPTSHHTKFTVKICLPGKSDMCWLFSNYIGDQCLLEAINTLNCLKTCHQILTNELWNVWRSSNLRGGCSDISHSHTKYQRKSLPTKTRGPWTSFP